MSTLSYFTRCSDQIVEFNAGFDEATLNEHSKISLEILKTELIDIWSKTKNACEKCLQTLKDEDEVEAVKAKQNSTFKDYLSCLSRISEGIQKYSVTADTASYVPPAQVPKRSNNLNLPPCDTEIFHGDYVSWPSFRDLFTAIYINNADLSNIEKLFHLRHKTSGEARDIVSKPPLSNEGFDIAWSNLKAAYENKRVLVNKQLKLLFSLPVIRTESAPALKELQRGINGCLSALATYNVNVGNWDPILIFLCSNRLPETTLSLWEQTLLDKAAIPEWSQMDAFLTQRFRTLESIVDVKWSASSSSTNQHQKAFSHQPNPAGQKKVSLATNISQSYCIMCQKQQHPLRLCTKFLSLSINDRFTAIKKHNCCLNCLSKGHSIKDCKSQFSCTKCKSRHHTLLHRVSSNTQPPKETAGGTASQAFHTNIQSASSNSMLSTAEENLKSSGLSSALLGTAMVHICHLGSTYIARALIDSASEASFISERLRKLLKLPYSKTNAVISGLNQRVSNSASKICSFVLGSPRDPNLLIEATAFVLPQITGNLPSTSIDESILEKLPKVPLADSKFLQSGPIDVLIGGDLYPKVMLDGVKRSIQYNLLSQETVFGWIVTGASSTAHVSCFATKVSMGEDISLDSQLRKFWELEEVPKNNLQSDEDMFCEELYLKTTTRNSEGRYVVSLPFKNFYPTDVKLGSSRPIAFRQFIRNEARLTKNPSLKEEYDKVVQEYLDLGHMEKVEAPSFEHSPSHFYLPHHAVLKPESTSTKLRVVFNASSNSSNGVCLNDILHVGPTLQADLTLLLIRWRMYKYVFNSDIQKMYRQILVNPSHRPYQRILFRKDPHSGIQDFQLRAVTFGVNCAPYLAIRTLRQLAQDSHDSHPLAAQILRNSMYVDDVLAGFHDVSTALQARDQLIEALDSAGFSLRKWSSNSKEILMDLPHEHLLKREFLTLDETSTTKALGIRWNARLDHFFFSVQTLPSKDSYTKREVLSTIAKLFDPAGWLAPVVVVAKIVMQQIWSDGTLWDQPISSQTLFKWKTFVESYRYIDDIKIPRWVNFTIESPFEVHAFCDASEKAYAGVIYLRVENHGTVSSHLLLAKTKVAPIKTISLPRLELCGAVLVVDMLRSLLSELPFKVENIFCWTDSTIVLSWLKKRPCSWTTFVANRVAKIQELVGFRHWNHVDSKDNPADLGSRGAYPQDLCASELWWYGPSWLGKDAGQWPSMDDELDDITIEARKIKAHASLVSSHEDPLERFSSLPRALRVLAYVFRFYNRTNRHTRRFHSYPSLAVSGEEISKIRIRLIILAQMKHFLEEQRCLTSKTPISPKSKLLTLNPFLDCQGIMRVNGRLANSLILSYNEKHPILLPYSCSFSRLLVHLIHNISLHGGNQLMLRLLRQQYWIPKAKNLIKTVIHNCRTCVIHKKRNQSQIMAALPEERTTLSRPFQNTGVDFAGPFDIKSFTGRACKITKGYVCIFVCFSTRAIHLEGTSDLSTETFLGAFSRFISRRSCPQQIFSDNGTNFVGAAANLKKEFKKFLTTSRESLCNMYSHQEVSWNFIPAGAPHMGGLWEAGVKSIKFHFRRTAASQKFTFEEFQTLLCRIESCLNSRPISPNSTDAADCAALTPGHFLTGGPILSPPEPSIEANPVSIINRWQKIKALSQQHSLRWKEEYLKELHKRYKWKSPQKDIAVDDLVVVRHENLPPNEWRLGRVTKIYKGSDKRIRVADIRTQKGLITRPIVKLVVLPN
ncbi:PREDICTED: uncharacterized protein LOC108358328 isoform X2 [Rhagoletis zephyria]|uniref:uncharacterized protein LOC108358328 isoform X2 n=1 Tax=Rhagoletis zephyria TaxID=28612 RepID=UPI000811467B|nr:PREDICTED: uncharacterized protein LOC108358328 isoform X2 [Rhagoletis zephyria]